MGSKFKLRTGSVLYHKQRIHGNRTRNRDRAIVVALGKLAEFDGRKSQAIELKFFGGLTTEEIGLVLDISVAAVGRELRLGQAWLRREMSRSSAQETK
jgi:DNA-directed RNA polymerase specialized sigma24 family protein